MFGVTEAIIKENSKKEEDALAIHPLLTNPLFDNHFHTFFSNLYDSDAV